VSRKTETTEVVYSEKFKDEWQEVHKTVTTVTTIIERDDAGYPYTPWPTSPSWRVGRPGDYMSWYSSHGAVPAYKKPVAKDE
jgi:hypothetical protein